MIRLGFGWRLFVSLIVAASLVSVSPCPAAAEDLSDYFDVSYNPVEFSQAEIQGDVVFYATISGSATCNQALPLSASRAEITGRIVAQHQGSGTEKVLNPSYTIDIDPFPTEGETYSINQQVSLQFPSESPSGNYNVTGEIILAKVWVMGMGIDVTSFLPQVREMGSVTYLAPSSSSGGDQPSPTEPVTTHYYTIIQILGKDYQWETNSDGSLKQEVSLRSGNGRVSLRLGQGVICLDSNGRRLEAISITEEMSPPPAPQSCFMVGSTYDLRPNGTSFQPYLEISLGYDENDLSEGAEESNLYLAYWDESAGRWVSLPSQIDTQANTVTAGVSHFTTFAIIGSLVAPSLFTIADLSVSPTEVEPGGMVTVSALMSNDGGREGSYSLSLTLNEKVVDTKMITLAPGASQSVSFKLAREEAGNYRVALDGQSGEFNVVAPSLFTIADLSITPTEIKPGGMVTISALVSNESSKEGSHSLSLTLNGEVVDTRVITLAPGASQSVSFSLAGEEAGNYRVALDGQGGGFTVAAPFQWWVVMLAVAVVVIGVALYLLWRRRLEA